MGGKVAGVLTWKAGEGENLNFAAPSKLIAPLLKNSAVQPLGSVLKPSVVSAAGRSERVWTSLKSGRDYKVRIDGDYIYTEWVNLPPVLQPTAAFMRSELKKDGEKWIGKVRLNLPYAYKSSYTDFWRTGQQMGTENVNWCRAESEFEIDRISDSRIEGRSLSSNPSTSRNVNRARWSGRLSLGFQSKNTNRHGVGLARGLTRCRRHLRTT
jgi:hypothetical protein